MKTGGIGIPQLAFFLPFLISASRLLEGKTFRVVATSQNPGKSVFLPLKLGLYMYIFFNNPMSNRPAESTSFSHQTKQKNRKITHNIELLISTKQKNALYIMLPFLGN